MLCAASALYEAAYRPDTRLIMQHHLLRRACPWQVAPRLLLQLKAWAVAKRAAGGPQRAPGAAHAAAAAGAGLQSVAAPSRTAPPAPLV